ncbi:MAG TPA: 16S rRNA (cytosine(1402)-N(4))-methyltransferase RsmH [Desulfobacteraceae bacterium]|nr:16S rRNA (cytosine(1402)-N(4))-methyltransferase RsmH [Desulfobacteraceae bacterium]
MNYPHVPVLAREVVSILLWKDDGIFVDATAGSGGHSELMARNLGEGGRLVSIDRDPCAVEMVSERLTFIGDRARVIKGDFSDLSAILSTYGIERVDGILLDLGMSSYQLDSSGRGFSVTADEPLDMRMDPSLDITAWYLVNSLPCKDLEKILRDYGEERRAVQVARAICRAREKRAIETSLELSSLIASVFPPSSRFKARHPAIKSFQALRIAVNKELENLEKFLNFVPSLLNDSGRLLILSYHSLEDRLVKRAFSSWERGCKCPPDLPVCACGFKPLFLCLTRKGIRAQPDEVESNPRARSAVLRAARRVFK